MAKFLVVDRLERWTLVVVGTPIQPKFEARHLLRQSQGGGVLHIIMYFNGTFVIKLQIIWL